MKFHGRFKKQDGTWKEWAVFNDQVEAVRCIHAWGGGRETEILSEEEYDLRYNRITDKSPADSLPSPTIGFLKELIQELGYDRTARGFGVDVVTLWHHVNRGDPEWGETGGNHAI